KMQCSARLSPQMVSPKKSDRMESDQPKQDADLNLVYRAKFLGNIVRKLREEGIKVGYHIFVALQDLNAVSRGTPQGKAECLPAGKSPEYHYSLHDWRTWLGMRQSTGSSPQEMPPSPPGSSQ